MDNANGLLLLALLVLWSLREHLYIRLEGKTDDNSLTYNIDRSKYTDRCGGNLRPKTERCHH